MADIPNIKDAKELNKELGLIESTLTSISVLLTDKIHQAFEEVEGSAKTIAQVYANNIEKSIKAMARNSDVLLKNTIGIIAGQNKSKDIGKQLVNIDVQRAAQARNIQALKDEGLISDSEMNRLQDDLAEQYEAQKGILGRQKSLIEEITKKVGLTGKLLGEANKIPIIGKFIDSETALAKMNATAADGGNKLKVLGAGFEIIGKSIIKGISDPITLITFFIKSINKADEQTTALAKSLMQTKGEATATREQFVGMANASGDAFINTNKLLEANAALSKQLGFNKVFSQDINQTFVDLTKKINLSEEAAGGLARISIATGRTLKSTEQIIAATTSRISAQNGIQLDGKDILEESGKISGQLLANFKGNPAAIAEAVAQAKVLGTTLEQTKSQSEKLLDFESSIGNQLKAEVLTSKQLNLEQARYYALQGDQAKVAKELASQGASFNEFTRMNVIQQRSLAEALGLSADQLSDQLLKQEAIGKSREEIVALGGEEAAQRLESLTAQDKFNAAIEKLKDLVGNLVAGPFGQLLDMVADIAGIILKIIQPFVSVIGAVIKPITGVISGALGPLNTSLANAGFSSTGAAVGGGGESVIDALKDVKSAIVAGNNKQFGVNLDGRAVGTGVVRATYKSA